MAGSDVGADHDADLTHRSCATRAEVRGLGVGEGEAESGRWASGVTSGEEAWISVGDDRGNIDSWRGASLGGDNQRSRSGAT